jgi:hypothetical protein
VSLRAAVSRPLMRGVAMTPAVKGDVFRERCDGTRPYRLPRPSEEQEPVSTTVDHADGRGLGPTCLVAVGRLPRSRPAGFLLPLHAAEDGATPGRLLVRGSAHASARTEGHREHPRECALGPSRVIAQIHAAIARAMATTTWCGCFPRAVRSRQR